MLYNCRVRSTRGVTSAHFSDTPSNTARAFALSEGMKEMSRSVDHRMRAEALGLVATDDRGDQPEAMKRRRFDHPQVLRPCSAGTRQRHKPPLPSWYEITIPA